jgi:hypothetical protein
MGARSGRSSGDSLASYTVGAPRADLGLTPWSERVNDQRPYVQNVSAASRGETNTAGYGRDDQSPIVGFHFKDRYHHSSSPVISRNPCVANPRVIRIRKIAGKVRT